MTGGCGGPEFSAIPIVAAASEPRLKSVGRTHAPMGGYNSALARLAPRCVVRIIVEILSLVAGAIGCIALTDRAIWGVEVACPQRGLPLGCCGPLPQREAWVVLFATRPAASRCGLAGARPVSKELLCCGSPPGPSPLRTGARPCAPRPSNVACPVCAITHDTRHNTTFFHPTRGFSAPELTVSL